MATVKEEFELLKTKILAGKENEVVHLVWHDKEHKRKTENPQQSTRIVLNMRTPEAWKEFQIEKERIFSIAVDPHIALGFMIRALREVSDETLRSWLKEGEEEEPEEPEWLRE